MPNDREMLVALVATIALGLCGLYVSLRRFFAGPRSPDPWDETVTAQIESPDSDRLCHRCVTPHSDHEHYCPNCGAAVGDYNNLLPFEQLFSEGEVFRNGTTQRFKLTGPIMCGYLLASLAAYAIVAPIYWFFLLRSLVGRAPVAVNGGETPPP
jgi:hypothetical protein